MQIVDASNISGNPYLETEHSRKDVAIFCKRIKFEEFGLEVWPFGWSFRANTSNTAMKEEKFPNTQGRRSFSDPRQTVLLLYISSSLSAFLFFSCDFSWSERKAALISSSFFWIPFEIEVFQELQFQSDKDVVCHWCHKGTWERNATNFLASINQEGWTYYDL